MSGALKSVFGGGNIFGALLSVASAFFPPLAIAGSLSNMLTGAIGQAVKMAASTLVKEFGMPKFLEGIIGQVIDKVLPQHQQQSSPDVDAFTSEKFGPSVNQFKQDFAGELVKQVIKNVKQDSDKRAGSGKSSAKTSGGSWLEAIARAMGEVMGEKAAKMVDLSNQLSQLSADGKAQADALTQKYGDVGSLKGEKLQQYTTEKSSQEQQNAREMTRINSELSGTGQMFQVLQNAFNNTIKSIGEALAQTARKG